MTTCRQLTYAATVTARPARGIVLVYVPPGLPWQAAFIAALRNQSVTWGGTGNVLVPWSEDLHENPLFWEIVAAQDPDLIITAPGSWSDLSDLVPGDFARVLTGNREQWLAEGVHEAAIQHLLDELASVSFADLDYDMTSPLHVAVRNRASPFHMGDRAFDTTSTCAHPTHDLLVDARELTTGKPGAICVPTGDLGWSERLGVVAAVGDLSDLARRTFEAGSETRVLDLPVSSSFEATRLAMRPVPPENAAFPFQLAEVGLQWARFGYAYDPVSIVVGDEPWDFALFYALRRLTSAAFWLPSEWANDEYQLHSIRSHVERHRRDPSITARVLSASDPDLAEQVAGRLALGAKQPASQWPHQDWRGVLPRNPSRLFCEDSMRASQSLAVHDRLTSIVDTPVPNLVTRNPLDMDWVVDVRLDRWAPYQDPELGKHLVAGGEHSTTHVRTIHGGVSYRATGPFRAAGVPIRAQLLAPQIRPLDLLDQLQQVARQSGYDVQLSDKGIFAEETADLCGGPEALNTILSNAGGFVALCNLALVGTGARAQVDQRWVWTYPAAAKEAGALGLGSLRQLVARGLLQRGLVHKCPRCARAQWIDARDLGDTVRCPRCRLTLAVNDGQWLDANDDDPPAWLLRVNEMVWQFLDKDGDVPFRAAHAATANANLRRPAAITYEIEVLQDGERQVELDFCASWDGQLILGEGKVVDRLAKTATEEKRVLAKLKQAADALRADTVLLATAAPAWRDETVRLANEKFPGPWPVLVTTSAQRPGTADDET